MSNSFQWLLVISCAAMFIISDALSAHWGKNGNNVSIFLVFFTAPLGYFLFGILNKNKSLSVSSGLVNTILVIGTILIGVLIFNDQLSVKQILGLVLAISALILLG